MYHIPRTFPVLIFKVPCTGKPLSPRHTRMLGCPTCQIKPKPHSTSSLVSHNYQSCLEPHKFQGPPPLTHTQPAAPHGGSCSTVKTPLWCCLLQKVSKRDHRTLCLQRSQHLPCSAVAGSVLSPIGLRDPSGNELFCTQNPKCLLQSQMEAITSVGVGTGCL